MKSIIITGLSLFTVVLMSCDKNEDVQAQAVPQIVQEAFDNQFSGATDVEWETTTNGYEVEFDFQKHEYEAEINDQGDIIRSKHEINVSDLPEEVGMEINRNYSGKQIDDVDELIQDDITYYMIEFDTTLSEKVVVDNKGQEVSDVEYWD